MTYSIMFSYAEETNTTLYIIHFAAEGSSACMVQRHGRASSQREVPHRVRRRLCGVLLGGVVQVLGAVRGCRAPTTVPHEAPAHTGSCFSQYVELYSIKCKWVFTD